MIEVTIAEYFGEGFWAYYPPYEFPATELESVKAFVRSLTGARMAIKSVVNKETGA